MTTKPPPHLRPATRAWFANVTKEFALEEHHLRLLQLAGEAWDRSQEAREILGKDGIVVKDDRGNLRPHPCVNIERDARLAFARLVRELDLDIAPPSIPSRPPALGSNSRKGRSQ